MELFCKECVVRFFSPPFYSHLHVVTSEGEPPTSRSSLEGLQRGTINDFSQSFSRISPRTKIRTFWQFTDYQNTSLCFPGQVMLNSSSAFLLVTKYTPCVSQTKKKTAELVWAHLFIVTAAIFWGKNNRAWCVDCFRYPLGA